MELQSILAFVKGLISRWKSMITWLVGIHCFSHRLELAVQDNCKVHQEKVATFLLDIYLHFRNSPKRWSALTKIAESLNIKLYVIPKPSGTRFVAHRRNAAYAIRWNWVPLILYFSNEKENGGEEGAKASAYLADYLLNIKFITQFAQFEDIMNLLTETSKIIQYEESSSIADAINELAKLRLKMELMKEVPGELEADMIERVGNSVDADEAVNLRRETRTNAGNNENAKAMVLK